MRWAAVAVVAAALLTGGCNDAFVQGDVIVNMPGGGMCASNAGGKTVLLTIQSSANHVDPNDPNKSWVPTTHDICVTPEVGAAHPVGSRYAN